MHPRGFLGVEWSAPAPGGPASSGLQVRRVLGGSPAARAGLQADDEVLRINGKADRWPQGRPRRPGRRPAGRLRRAASGTAAAPVPMPAKQIIVNAGEGL